MNREFPQIDHIPASELHRLKSFERWGDFPIDTRRQLAIAGFILQDSLPTCTLCGITIEPEALNKDEEYPENTFRSIHRQKVVDLGKRCGFLLCDNGSNIENVRESISSKNLKALDDAENPEFRDFSARLASFDEWPIKTQIESQAELSTINVKNMATHGFFYSGPDDGVTCFYCGNTLLDWRMHINSKHENIVQLEHARFFPCRFINYTAGGKFVANAAFFHPVNDSERRRRNPMTWKAKSIVSTAIIAEDEKPTSVDACLETFYDWPSSAPISAGELAAVGFYYLHQDHKVRCFVCDLEISDWLFGMTALGTHRRRRQNCRFVQSLQNSNNSNFQAMNEKWRLETLSELSLIKQWSPDKESEENLAQELAACGFFRMKNKKIIRCAFCGVTIEPRTETSIMFQHRSLVKRSVSKHVQSIEGQSHQVHIDCPMVRANCPANVSIPGRKRFPEHPSFQQVFQRKASFDAHKNRRNMTDAFIEELANAGFFFNTSESRGMRCFQCGNFCPIKQKKSKHLFGTDEIIRIHAHLYPTCEWVEETLGPKYVAQVLHDRYKSNSSMEYSPQLFRTASSVLTSTSLFGATTQSSTDLCSSTSNEKVDDEYDSDRHHDSSSDEEYKPVATPATSMIMQPSSQSPSFVARTSSDPSMTAPTAETCRDPTISPTSPESKSPFSPSQLANYQRQESARSKNPDDNIRSPERSPSIPSLPGNSKPVDLLEITSHESNRLETFASFSSQTFAGVEFKHLAYVGFYLTANKDRIQCPWCEVELTEEQFLDIVESKPSAPIPNLVDEIWTPMRVHRHANGLIIDDKNPWCPWVRRQMIGLHPNVPLETSLLQFPEYPTYADLSKRVASFTNTWVYSISSRLSPANMAHAGFFHIGDDSVCCYYCGNKLQRFEPKDCPVEEHATFYPYCDYIQRICGMDYIRRIVLEYGQVPQGRFKYETEAGNTIKRIFFTKSGTSRRKLERAPASRNRRMETPESPAPNQPMNTPAINPTDKLVDDTCIVCCDHVVLFEYSVCHHAAVCGDCSDKLDQRYREECMLCHRPGVLVQRSLP